MNPIDALLTGGGPADTAELAHQLRRRELLGTVGQLSGDKLLMPVGQQLTSSARKQAAEIGERRLRRSLEAQRNAAAERRANMLARSNPYRGVPAWAQKEAYELERDTSEMGNIMEKAETVKDDPSFAQKPGWDSPRSWVKWAKSVPLFGEDLSKSLAEEHLSPEVRAFDTQVASTVNTIRHSEFGAALSLHEAQFFDPVDPNAYGISRDTRMNRLQWWDDRLREHYEALNRRYPGIMNIDPNDPALQTAPSDKETMTIRLTQPQNKPAPPQESAPEPTGSSYVEEWDG